MATFSIADAFRGASAPAPWFQLLERSPLAAASQLVFGTGNFSHYQAADPLSLALQWLKEVRDPSFAETLDVAFAEWVEQYWGVSIHPDSAGSAALTAEAWQMLALIVSGYPGFGKTADALRHRVLHERNFLLAIGEGPTTDPAGRALQAISRYQKDDSLRDFWFELTALPPHAPWYHGEYAIDGLCHIPFAGKGIHPAVPGGLRRLAVSLATRESEGWLDAKLARRHFLRVTELTQRRFPFPERWRSFWLQATLSVRNETVKAWIQTLCGFSEKERNNYVAGLRPDPSWRGRAAEISRQLDVNSLTAIEAARVLLDEEERYLRMTGDSYAFVRSACDFAKHVKDKTVGLDWAQSARRSEPQNPFPWTIELACLLALGRPAEALAIGVVAVQRFPDNVFARTGLGEVLKTQGRLVEAEQVYRETAQRFPNNVFARTGLGDVLKTQGRLAEAEQIYRETVHRFPDDEVARNGLGDVLKMQGRLAEAEQIYRETVHRFPENVFARTGLQSVLKGQQPLATAELSGSQEKVESSGPLSALPEGEQAEDGELGVLAHHVDQKENFTGIVAGELSGNLQERSDPGTRSKGSGDQAEEQESTPQPTFIRESDEEKKRTEATDQRGVSPLSVAEPRLEQRDIEILLTDFLLLRKWSRANEPIDQLRARAQKLIDRVGRHIYDDAVLAAEGAHVLMGADLADSLRLLTEATRRFPGSAKLAYARARAERLHVRALRPAYQSGPGRQAVLSWNRLARLDSAFEPLQLMGLSRTLPLLHDGAELEKQTRDRLGNLANRIHRMTLRSPEDSFDRHWAVRVQEVVFAGEPVAADQLGSLPELTRRLEENYVMLDALEGQYVDARAVI